MSELAWSVARLAREVGVSESQVYASIRSGEIPAKKRGRNYLIKPEDARAWFEGLPDFKPVGGAA